MKVSPSLVRTALPLLVLTSSCQATLCRSLPGDASWPSVTVWNRLNSTVDGRLVKTVPLGSPCHDPNYNADACAALQDAWNLPQTHIESSSSVMQAYFANQSCDPFLPESRPCLLGNYVSYAVKVSNSKQVAATVKFANKYNIRLVVRNTGHDYFGRSTGAGGLAIWTHEMNSAEYVDYSDALYKGPAFKFGAGILGSQAVEAVNAKGLAVVSGECPTVGLAGGYSQGGGHSVLSTAFGLGADQTLEFEAVTAAGTIVKASSRQNSDLYWAMSGGGGGNYAIVTSLTVRAHNVGKIGGAALQMTVAGISKETFDEAVLKFHELMPAMIDQGASVIYYVTNQVLVIMPITVVNSTGDFVREKVLGPFTDELARLGIKAAVSYSTLGFYEHYDTYSGPLPYGHLGVSDYQFGGRLIPRSVIENDNESFQEVIRNITANGVIAVGSAGTYKGYKGVSNAVLPQWRSSIMSMQIGTPWDSTNWDKMLADQKRITNEYVPLLTSVTPGAGAYLNEADFNQPSWEETFYGANWVKLSLIKKKWDPTSVFYNFKGVGSDAWTVANNGRMCRKF
ncbi:Fc.00g012120.m01.CDS01 [Cosmosporella sp. VM-42]